MKTENPLESSQKPPSSNRGVENLRQPYSIDWINGSFPILGMESPVEIHETLLYIFGMTNHIVGVIRPRKGFSAAVQLQIGRLDIQDSGEEFAGFQLTGQEMKAFRAQGGSEQGLLSRLIEKGGHPSRVDLAIDVFDNPIASIRDLVWEYRMGQVKTLSKASRVVEDLATGGQTLYIGSRSSEVMGRWYNKAIESGNLDLLWLRMELEVKGKSSRRLGQQIANIGLEKSIRWWFEKYQFSANWYRDILRNLPLYEPPQIIERKTDKRLWLENQVLPALRKMEVSEPETLKWFLEQVQAEFGQGTEGGS